MLQTWLYNGLLGCLVSLARLLGQAGLEAIMLNNRWGFKFDSLPRLACRAVSMISTAPWAGDWNQAELPTELPSQTGPPPPLSTRAEVLAASPLSCSSEEEK